MTERRSPSPASDNFVDRAVYGGLPLSEQLKIGALADKIVSEGIFVAPIDTPDKKSKNRKAGSMLQEETGFQVSNLGEFKQKYGEAGNDEKRKALEGITRLTGAVTLVMRGDEELSAQIPLGAEKINEVLPEVWKGLGQGVIETEIKDEKVKKILEGLDRVRGTVNEGEARYARTMSRALERQIDQLSDLIMEGEGDMDEATMVAGFLNNELGKVEGLMAGDPVDATSQPAQPDQQNQVDPAGQMGQDEITAWQRAYYEEQVKLSENIKKFSYDDWKRGLLDKTGQVVNADNNMWALKTPDWLPGVGDAEWRRMLGAVDKFNLAVRGKRADDGFGKDLNEIKSKILNMTDLKSKEMSWMYNHPQLRLKEVMRVMMNELFEEKIIKGEVEGKKRETTIYVLKDSRSGYVAEARDYQRDEGRYKREAARRLRERGVFGLDECECSEISVSLAMDILEMGGQLELADTRRTVGDMSDALRMAMRPETKFVPKLGKEIWGGPWGEYLSILYGRDNEAMMAEVKRLGVIPELLSGSFLNQEVKTENGEMDFGKALREGAQIRFEESTKDLYFSWRKDGVLAACDLWSYINGKVKLEIKSFNELDNVIGDWRTALANAVGTLRSNGHSLVPVEVVAGAVGASTGVWPFEKEGIPFLRLPYKSVVSITSDYYKVGMEISRLLSLDDEERERFLDFFGIRREQMTTLRRNIADYEYNNSPDAIEMFKRKRR